ncbi:hypothetical protein [Streptomyces sp. NPDC056628]|uniref:hypothetical protein n=1 Tax=Streptomyces sp. NPDC056628 TaxID=3345882 RepID=UPI00368B4B11
MPDPDLTALAMTGATTVVAAMSTSAWEAVRARIAALFHQGGDSQSTVEAQLDRSAARVTSAGECAEARDGETTRWCNDLLDLLRERPEVAGDIQALIDEVQPQLPSAQQQWIQHVTARDGGMAVGAQGPGSSIHVHHYAASGQVQPPTPTPDPGVSDTP